MIASRRRFLFSTVAALVAAPAIVRVAANLMPISAWDRQPRYYGDGIRSDLPHLQWLIDQAQPGLRITLDPGTYFLNGPLDLGSVPRIAIDGHASTLDFGRLWQGGPQLASVFTRPGVDSSIELRGIDANRFMARDVLFEFGG